MFLELIQNLPKITEDPLYNRASIEKSENSKKSERNKSLDANQRISHSSHSTQIADKKAWFGENKDNSSNDKHSGVIFKN
jgi:hypothetical protein